MPQIAPFKGILYNKEKVRSLDLVLAPPFDVISSEQQKELYERSPWNVIRLILGYEEPNSDTDNRYTRAARDWKQWLEQGILQEDPVPAIYLCEEEYTLADQKRVRKGFMALVRLEDFDSGSIRPHEYTMEGPKADRLKLMRATQANLSQILSVYSAPWQTINRLLERTYLSPPELSATDRNGTMHKIWRVTEERVIEQIAEIMKDKSIFIADGHHRYETALAFRDEMRKRFPDRENGGYEYVPMYFSNLNDEGTSILPVHRMVRNVPNFDTQVFLNKAAERFEIREITDTHDVAIRKMLDEMRVEPHGHTAFGLYVQGRAFVLALNDIAHLDDATPSHKPREWRELAVTVLQYLLIENVLGLDADTVAKGQHIDYTIHAGEAAEMVDSGARQLAFFVNPTKPSEVCSVALQGERMPQKSTYFYPKLLSGLAMRRISDL